MPVNDPVGGEPCRICGAGLQDKLYTVNTYELARCSACAFVQVLNLDIGLDLEDLYGEAYFESAKYDDQQTQARENDRRIELLDSVLDDAQSKVLDAGCATGDFIAAARSRYELFGVDLSPAAIAQAQKLYPDIAERFSASPLDVLPFADNYFDAITLWDVIEHVRDPVDTCRSLARCLKPGGFLLLSTPDIGSLTARILKGRWAFMTPPEHLGFFSAKSATHLLEEVLAMEIVESFTRGKWVNAGFLAYKLRRVFPEFVPNWLVNGVKSSWIGNCSLYVPTQDIRYVTSRKRPV